MASSRIRNALKRTNQSPFTPPAGWNTMTPRSRGQWVAAQPDPARAFAGAAHYQQTGPDISGRGVGSMGSQIKPGGPGQTGVAPPPPPSGQSQPNPAPLTWEQRVAAWLGTDPAYQGQLNQSNTGRQGAFNQYTGSMLSGLQGFGLNDDQPVQVANLLNPSAGPVSLTPLAADPFSRADILKESLLTANKTSVNSYAAGGQLYSGALRRMVGADGSDYQQRGAWDLATQDGSTYGGSALLDGYNQRQFQQGWSGLVRDRDEFVRQTTGTVQDAINAFNQGDVDALGDAMARLPDWLLDLLEQGPVPEPAAHPPAGLVPAQVNPAPGPHNPRGMAPAVVNKPPGKHTTGRRAVINKPPKRVRKKKDKD